MMRNLSGKLIPLLICVAWAVAVPAADPQTSCVTCHSNGDYFDEAGLAIARDYAQDIHAEARLSCHDCHGGNPDPALSDDMDAMSPSYAPNRYVGAPDRKDIPVFCGKCHSSLEYMRKYDPTARVDQLDEYWTSQHGKALRAGSDRAATCVDCHGIHGIRKVDSPESAVFPTKVAETCSHCHSNPETMQGVLDPRGNQIPVDQHARWQRSVHAKAMFEKGDNSAPTCNDCHGNHGAAPPGVASVGYICGNCHGREAGLFRDSVKAEAFENHNEIMEGSSGCGDCHDDKGDIGLVKFTECVTCHENHAVIRPTSALLGGLPETPCVFCHEGGGELASMFEEPEKTISNYHEKRSELLATAAQQNLTGDQLYDWMVDQTLALPNHRQLGAEGVEGPEALRPEFRKLFEKFRIGKTHYSYDDPVTGASTTVRVTDCATCHTGEDSAGRLVASQMLADLTELSGAIASGERTLLFAHRGGVEVREAREATEQAVDSAIELEVLVHTFSHEGAFQEKKVEGLQHAEAALAAGRESLAELAYRRKGLFVSLILIALVLVALALKIRHLG
jgi:hypothetical protein